jgi:uridine kinase
VPGSNNAVAIDLICTHIRQKFQERSSKFCQKIAIPHRYLSPSGVSSGREDLNLTIHPQTNQLKVCFDFRSKDASYLLVSQGIFTILRDKTTNRQDFVFFTDRLSTLLVEHALELLPHVPKTVVTPVGVEAHGQKIDAQVSANYYANFFFLLN